MIEIKKKLKVKCREFVDERMKTIQQFISSNQNALQNEMKSSVGDKHETGRAMLQLEMEKASFQLDSIYKMNEIVSKINFNSKSDVAKLGSLVITSNGNYFLAISAGTIKLKNKIYYAVSLSSPIGNQFLGANEGDKIDLNGKRITIKKIY